MSELQMGERIKLLQAMRKKHGSFEDIPESELTTISYVRVAIDGMVRILPVEKHQSEVATERAVATPQTLKEKYEIGLPFRELTFEVSGSSEEVIATVPRIKIVQDMHKLSAAGIKEILPESPLHTLRKTEFKWLLDSAADYLKNAANLRTELAYDGFSDFVPEEVDPETGDDFFSGADALAALESLDRLKSILGDVDQYTHSFNSGFLGNGPEAAALHHNDLRNGIVRDENEYDTVGLGQTGISTGFSELLRGYLAKNGLADVADGVTPGSTADEVAARLEEKLSESTEVQALQTRLKELQKQQRRQDLAQEDRHALQAEVSALRQQVKDARKSVQAVIDYLLMPQRAAKYFRSKISTIQKQLKTMQSDRTVAITIDATFNAEKDHDPGSLSKDCTEGKPLPFAELSVPVFNLKVIIDQAHVGNIYLVKVAPREGDDEVHWHLEAIQIPSRRIDWSRFTPSFINALAEQAEAAGVSAITCNTEDHLISNFDYIGENVLKYAIDHGDEDTEIKYPFNAHPDKYSNFQGHGEAMVLWRADK